MKKLISTLPAGQVYCLTNGAFILEVDCGVHISRACGDAAAWSSRHATNLAFTFNDIHVTATPASTGDALLAEFNRESNRRAEVYRASPEYVAAQKREAEQVAECQVQLDAIVAELPSVLDDAPRLLDCLCRLSDVGDRIGVKCDHRAVAATLESKWKRSDCVGMLPDTIQADPQLMARYIVGQAIDCLRRHMPPHPMIRTFAEQYLASLA